MFSIKRRQTCWKLRVPRSRHRGPLGRLAHWPRGRLGTSSSCPACLSQSGEREHTITSNLLIQNLEGNYLFQHEPHRLKSQGAGINLVDVELEACVEVELSLAESFDDPDPQS